MNHERSRKRHQDPRLLELLLALKERSLKPAVALYVIWNQDLSGRSAPDPGAERSHLKSSRLLRFLHLDPPKVHRLIAAGRARGQRWDGHVDLRFDHAHAPGGRAGGHRW